MDVNEVSHRDSIVKILGTLGLDTGFIRKSGTNIMIGCPFAKAGGHSKSVDSTPSFGIRLENGKFLYNCFSCGRRGRSLIDFVLKLQQENIVSSKVNAYEIQNSLKITYPSFIVEGNDEKKTDVLELGDCVPAHTSKSALEYLRSRGLKDRYIKDMEIYYDRENKTIIYACYDKTHALVGKVSRSLNGKGSNYYNDGDVGSFLYYEWKVKGCNGIIVEGMHDVLKLHQHLCINGMNDDYSVVGLFGSEVTDLQCKKLIRNFSSLFVMGDNDMAGIKMEKMIYRKCHKKLPTIFSCEYEGKDPDRIESPKLLKRVLSMAKIKVWN